MSSFQHHKQSKLHWEQGSVYDLSWSQDGALLTAAGSKGPVRSWRLERGGHKEGEPLKGIEGDIERLSWNPSPQHSHVLAAATYRQAQMWDQRQGSIFSKLESGGAISGFSWHPSGRYLAVFGRDAGLSVYDMAQPSKPLVLAGLQETVYSVTWTANSLLLLTTHRGSVEVFGWPSMEHVTSVQAHSAPCNALAVDPRGQRLATGGADATVSLWRAEDLSIQQAVDGYGSPLMAVGFSYDGRYVGSISDDLEAKIHEAFSGELASRLPMESMATCLEWHPHNLALAYGTGGSSKGFVKPAVTIYLKT